MFAHLKKGPVAEWLGRGLQNLVQRFKSARDLNKIDYLVLMIYYLWQNIQEITSRLL